jgi:hypothetical protein
MSHTAQLGLTALEHVGFVMKDGKVCKQKVGSSAGN